MNKKLIITLTNSPVEAKQNPNVGRKLIITNTCSPHLKRNRAVQKLTVTSKLTAYYLTNFPDKYPSIRITYTVFVSKLLFLPLSFLPPTYVT